MHNPIGFLLSGKLQCLPPHREFGHKNGKLKDHKSYGISRLYATYEINVQGNLRNNKLWVSWEKKFTTHQLTSKLAG